MSVRPSRADVQCQPGQAGQVATIGRAQSRRLTVVQPADDVGETAHAAVMGLHGLLVGIRNTTDAGAGDAYVAAVRVQADADQPAAGHAQAMLVQRQLLADAVVEQVQQVCAGRNPEAGCEFAGDGRTARLGRRFQHGHLVAGSRQVGGAHQAVVAGADDDDAGVVVSHRASPPARYSAAPGPPGSPARHSRRARP